MNPIQAILMSSDSLVRGLLIIKVTKHDCRCMNTKLTIAAGWQLGGLYLGAGYHSIDSKPTGATITATGGLVFTDVMAVTASYKFTNFGVSVGYTVRAPRDSTPIESLLERADRALMKSKAAGRNRVNKAS